MSPSCRQAVVSIDGMSSTRINAVDCFECVSGSAMVDASRSWCSSGAVARSARSSRVCRTWAGLGDEIGVLAECRITTRRESSPPPTASVETLARRLSRWNPLGTPNP